MRRVLWLLSLTVAGFLIFRAVIELFVVDFSDPSSYESDWGGPSLFGVLLVDMGPGILAAPSSRRAPARVRTGGSGDCRMTTIDAGPDAAQDLTVVQRIRAAVLAKETMCGRAGL